MPILTILELTNFDSCNFAIAKIPKSSNWQSPKLLYGNFLDFRFATFDFTENLSGRKIHEFPHCEATRYFSMSFKHNDISSFWYRQDNMCIVTENTYKSFCNRFLQNISDRLFWLNSIQGVQDHFLRKEMLISLSILKLHKNPWIWEGLRTIHFI